MTMTLENPTMDYFGDSEHLEAKFHGNKAKFFQKIMDEKVSVRGEAHLEKMIMEKCDPFYYIIKAIDAKGPSRSKRLDVDVLLKNYFELRHESLFAKDKKVQVMNKELAEKNLDTCSQLCDEIIKLENSPINYFFSGVVDLCIAKSESLVGSLMPKYLNRAVARFILADELGMNAGHPELNIRHVGYMIKQIEQAKEIYEPLMQEFGKGKKGETLERMQDDAIKDSFKIIGTPAMQELYFKLPGITKSLLDANFPEFFYHSMFNKAMMHPVHQFNAAYIALHYTPENYDNIVVEYLRAAAANLRTKGILDTSSEIPMIDTVDFKKVKGLLDHANKLNGQRTSHATYKNLADHYARREDRQKAILALDRAIILQPDPDYLIDRGRYHMILGNKKEAVLDLEQAKKTLEEIGEFKPAACKKLYELPNEKIESTINKNTILREDEKRNLYHTCVWLKELK